MELTDIGAPFNVCCSVLKVDVTGGHSFKLLLDCGIDDTFNNTYLAELYDVASDVDGILLTHGDIAHVGALPYLLAPGRLSHVKVYATLPARVLGRVAVYDAFHNRCTTEDTFFTVDDIETAFSSTRVEEVHFSQIKSLVAGLTIQPVPAGHTLGGAAWKIMRRGTDELLYAPSFSLRWDRHLIGMDAQLLKRANVIVTDCNGIGAEAPKADRDQAMLSQIIDTLRVKGGNVLIPCDPGSRVTDLLLYLDQVWGEKGLNPYPLVFLSHCPVTYTEALRSMTEYTNDTLQNQVYEQATNPLVLPHVTLCNSLAMLESLDPPMVVLATPITMNAGFSQQLLTQYGSDPKNTIVLSQRPPTNSIASKVYSAAGSPSNLEMMLWQRVPRTRQDDANDGYLHGTTDDSNPTKHSVLELMDDTTDDEDAMGASTEKDDRGAATESNKNSNLHLAPGLKVPASHQQQQRMCLPCVEPLVRVNRGYGEALDANWVKAWKFHEKTVAPLEDGEADVEPAHDVADDDYTLICYPHSMTCAASVIFADFENIVDVGTLKRVLATLPPIVRKVCMHGTPECLSAMQKWAATEPVVGRVAWLASTSAISSISLATHAESVPVKLHPDILTLSANRQRSGAFELIPIEGRLSFLPDSTTEQHDPSLSRKKREREDGGHAGCELRLDPLEASSRRATPRTVFVGDSSLSSVTTTLRGDAMATDFQRGLLVASQSVLVRRADAGDLLTESMIGPESYAVRRAIYRHFSHI
eukprot:PhM_4_TR2198/c0_g1_i1/m.41691/K14402/CPSF2, CFT2; cleavage and polyadenylation specificity factor subunit 2